MHTRTENDSDPNDASTRGEITKLLRSWSAGNQEALVDVMPLAFEDLRIIARKKCREIPCREVDPTELVGEIYATLLRQRRINLKCRGQFFNFAAILMRRVLLSMKRYDETRKRSAPTCPLDEADVACVAAEFSPFPGSAGALRDVSTALDVLGKVDELEELDPEQAEIVRLRFFLGLSIRETAKALGMPVATVNRRWWNAKRFLARELDGQGREP